MEIMSTNNSSYYRNTFIEWGVRNGYQKFISPINVELPEGITLNPYGWLPAPTATDLIFPLATIKPFEQKTIYWTGEEIVTNSTTAMRLSLEANFEYDSGTDTWNPDGWVTVAGYTVRSTKDMRMGGLAMLKTSEGESLRLRCFPINGNDNDWYFKFTILELPYRE